MEIILQEKRAYLLANGFIEYDDNRWLLGHVKYSVPSQAAQSTDEAYRIMTEPYKPDVTKNHPKDKTQELIWQTRDEMPSPTNPLQALHEMLAFSSRDLSEDKLIACMYGVILGWDDESYEEFKVTHNWTDENIAKQKEWHEAYKKAWNFFMENAKK